MRQKNIVILERAYEYKKEEKSVGLKKCRKHHLLWIFLKEFLPGQLQRLRAD